MKNKPLSKKQRATLIDAWAAMNVLCSYLSDYKKHPEYFTDKLDPLMKAKEIYKLLDSVITHIHDDDL